jgi:hypothetical protein
MINKEKSNKNACNYGEIKKRNRENENRESEIEIWRKRKGENCNLMIWERRLKWWLVIGGGFRNGMVDFVWKFALSPLFSYSLTP